MTQAAPPRRRLSPELILRVALRLVRKGGADALSIRKLADELKVSPMAVYRHYENKGALLSALFDAFIRKAEVLPAQDLPWDEWIAYVGQQMWKAQVAEPGWMGLLGSVQIRSGGLGVMLDGLRVLNEAGFTQEEALQAFFAMVHISIGAACVSLGLQQLDASQTFDPQDAGNLKRLQIEYGGLQNALAAQAVEHGLQLLVDGLRARRSALRTPP